MAFVVAAGDFVEHLGAVVEMAHGEALLDVALALEQPVESVVEIVLVGVLDLELFG